MPDKIVITNENYMDLDEQGRPIYTVYNTDLYKNRLAVIYTSMVQRCYNKNNKNYPNYGGHNITLCDEWKTSFAKFAEWSVKNGFHYQDESTLHKDFLSIDRIDSSKGYNPSNCRWLTISENCRRANHTKAIAASVKARIKSYKCVETGEVITNAEAYCREHGWYHATIHDVASPNNNQQKDPLGNHWQRVENKDGL